MVDKGKKVAVWWLRLGTLVRFSLFVLASVLVALIVYFSQSDMGTMFPGTNVAVFIFINLAIVLLLILLFVVGRNLVKLVFDRRNKILGSKLRLKLVASYFGLLVVPTVIVFAIANSFVTQAMEGWLSSPVESVVQGATRIGKGYLDSDKVVTEGVSTLVSQDVKRGRATNETVQRLREVWGVYQIEVLTKSGKALLSAKHPVADLPEFAPPILEPSTYRGLTTMKSEVVDRGGHSYIRTILPGVSSLKEPVFVVTMVRVDDEVLTSLGDIEAAYREYGQLRLFKNPLHSGYILSLSIVTGLILLSAIWFGIYLSREITTPIERLAEGTVELAKGNYDVQVREGGDDEIGVLVRSFNQMTTDLKASTEAAKHRGEFVETVLSKLEAGVITIDSDSTLVTLFNDSAARILGVSTLEGFRLNEITPDVIPGIESLHALVAHIQDKQVLEKQLSLFVRGHERQIVATVLRALGEKGTPATILVLEDFTELARSQQLVAWREVARRVAHEIKNPLTPIQLSAQRLEKITAKDPELSAKVKESASEIVRSVESIKRLADEFSRFARMPSAEMQPQNLNNFLAETVSPFAEIHGDVVFQIVADPKLPKVLIDREQLRRALVNLIDNSVAALKESKAQNPRVQVVSFYRPERGVAGFEVNDNGPGIPPQLKGKVFDPYFTTKTSGTGLGLAIVSSIVYDHGGTIRLYDNTPRGTKFVVELRTV